jgi:hypothetical protein
MGDKLFDEESKDDETKDDSKGKGKKTDSQSAGELKEIKQTVSNLDTAIKNIGPQIATAIADAMAAARPDDADPDEDLDPNELAKQLIADPKGTIIPWVTEEVLNQIRSKLGPHFVNQIEDAYDIHLEAERLAFDDVHGRGAFAKIIEPDLEGVWGKMPAEARHYRKQVRAVIRGIMGQRADEVYEARQEADKVRKNEQNQQPVVMMQNGIPIRSASRDKLSDEDLEFIAEHARETGREIDSSRMLKVRKARGTGGQLTYSDWQEAVGGKQ